MHTMNYNFLRNGFNSSSIPYFLILLFIAVTLYIQSSLSFELSMDMMTSVRDSLLSF